MSSSLNESSALQHFEHGNEVKIRNKILFNLHPGLPHKCLFAFTETVIEATISNIVAFWYIFALITSCENLGQRYTY